MPRKKPLIRKEHLGGKVNSPYSELAPIISPDGRLLFFTMGIGNPQNSGSYRNQDTYVSVSDNEGEWQVPQNLGSPMNTQFNESISGVSPDGTTLFFQSPGHNSANGLCFARKIGKSTWQIDSITIEKYSNSNSLTSQCISLYGEYIIMSLERPEGYGGLDLYVAKVKNRKNNLYGEPQNLGPVVNTSQNDFGPFLAADGNTLYYSTSGFRGYGGADVFKTKRLDDSWVNFSTPINMGATINTPGMDAYYSIPASGDMAYFSSATVGNQLDVFSIKLTDEQRPDPVLLMRGKVVSKRGHPIRATLLCTDIETNMEFASTISDEETGEFSIIVPIGSHYRLGAEADGYMSYSEDLDLSNLKGFAEPYEVIVLDKIAVGSSTTIGDVFFDFNESELKPESFFTLDKQAAILKANPNWIITVEGHTDSIGETSFNAQLSELRAKAVVTYLTDKGILPKRLRAVGKGDSEPIATNETEEGRQKNRRVVFRIIKIEK